ncbi:hypothetical protein C8Q77DRAFT_1148516 [Trametes polyzona]|nr:hypothetical protein C8Q77DRAFT_1148516 [Trametes polyzona]
MSLAYKSLIFLLSLRASTHNLPSPLNHPVFCTPCLLLRSSPCSPLLFSLQLELPRMSTLVRHPSASRQPSLSLPSTPPTPSAPSPPPLPSLLRVAATRGVRTPRRRR